MQQWGNLLLGVARGDYSARPFFTGGGVVLVVLAQWIQKLAVG